MVSDKELKRFVRLSRSEHYMSLQNIEKHAFEVLLIGMETKLIGKNGHKVESNLAQIKRMRNYLERQTNMNCIFHFQAKTIIAQDRQLAILEQEKFDLINELNNVKKRILSDEK